jgi:hypothetical protein
MMKTVILTFYGCIVLSSENAVAETIIVPTDSPTIANALITATNNTDDADIIILKQGTYSEHITLIDNVTLEAEDTAQTALTVIDGSGAGTVCDGNDSPCATIIAAKGSTIRRLTITNGDVGISIPSGATGVTIENNIITTHKTSGIQCTNTNTVITNNTIYNSGTAITCINSSITIKNNIFSNNTANDISLTIDASPLANFNLFSNNGNEDYVDTLLRPQSPDSTNNVYTPKVGNADPDFVDPNNNDFHLQKESPAIPENNGKSDDGTEIGVYGGGNNDRPFAITNLRVTTATDTSISVSWDPNLAHNVVDYKVYYNPDQPGTPANPALAGNTNIFTISGLSGSTPPQPSAPSNLSAGVGDGELLLSWSPANDFTVSEYKIHYGTVSVNDATQIVTGRSTTSYRLTGLSNNIPYHIAISAVATPVFFVTVTALDDASTPKESDFAPVQEAHLTSPVVESNNSAEITATPEQIVRFPDLPNEGGCFIATAAYGSPLEPHVQTLRVFRDRYLLTNGLGRGLVAVYYRVSPPLAHWLEAHASFKPMARALLSPIVFMTEFWMNIPSFAQVSIMILIISLGIISVYRWGIPNRGGHY